MKKLTSVLLALILATTVGASALANAVLPEGNVRPEQRGHVALLESIYGKTKTQEILEAYKHTASRSAPVPKHSIPEKIEEGVEIYYPIPDGSVPDLSRLRVGEYFTLNGRYYMVGRFSTVAGARVLVAFPATRDGAADPTNPKYFYF